MAELSPGFQINVNEMYDLSSAFQTVGQEYKALMPTTPPCPRGGNEVIDRTMYTTLQTINEMHTVFCEAIDQHSGRLQIAANNYVIAEENTGTAAQQVQKIVSREHGLNVVRAETALVQQYLSGSNAQGGVSPTTAVTMYGPQKPAGLAAVPDEAKIPARRTWIALDNSIICMDYPGLYRLVERLYAFVAGANPLMTGLAKRVANFCGPYKNYGDAVLEFNATYSEDASLMAGFHKIVVTVGRSIDNLAFALASLEAWVEKWGHLVGVPSSEFPLGSISTPEVRQQLANILSSTTLENVQDFVKGVVRALGLADSARQKTATQLELLAEAITTGGLDYYTDTDTAANSRDPGGVLNSDQLIGSHGTKEHPQGALGATRQLEQDLAKDGRLINDPYNTDLNADVASIGGYGSQIGEIADSLNGLRDAKNILEKTHSVGSVVGSISGLMQKLGGFVPVE